jgi:hypothetical protein
MQKIGIHWQRHQDNEPSATQPNEPPATGDNEPSATQPNEPPATGHNEPLSMSSKASSAVFKSNHLAAAESLVQRQVRETPDDAGITDLDDGGKGVLKT